MALCANVGNVQSRPFDEGLPAPSCCAILDDGTNPPSRFCRRPGKEAPAANSAEILLWKLGGSEYRALRGLDLLKLN